MVPINEKLRKGDRVRVCKLKFPELHPKTPQHNITPSGKDYILRASKVVGHEGEIIAVRADDDYSTDYEIANKIVEKYIVVIDFIPDKIEEKRKKQWMGKKGFWPEELEKL